MVSHARHHPVPTVVTIVLALTIAASAVPHGARQPAASVSFDVTEKSVLDLQRALESGEVTSRRLVELYLARVAAYDKQGSALNAIVAVNPDAHAAADRLDAERRAGRVRGPLHGIPVLLKDNFETLEMPTTAGSIALVGFNPGRDAFQVRRLKEAGAIVLGKTNMHELAAGITTIGSRGGQTRNPYDLDRNPGGSSGGTGAAIAASFAAAGMGSDTCGSIRNPASHNNLVGLRGTQGLSSRSGIVPLSSTQDIGGPLARTMMDLAIVLDATVGVDPEDAGTRAAGGRMPGSFREALADDALQGRRLGVLRGLFGAAPEDQEVTGIVNAALDVMEQSGAEVLEASVPGLDEWLRDSSLINADFKFDLADYLAGAPNAPVRSLAEILERGLYHAALESTFRTRNAVESRDSEQARRARVKRVALRQAVTGLMDEHRLDALVYPTLRRKPARIGDGQAGSNCQLSAHSGLPALGVPAGFTDDGVPVGMDLLGREFSDATLLAMGYAYEQAARFRRSPFSTPPLVGGKAPAPVRLTGIWGELVYDGVTGRLEYRLNTAALEKDGAFAVWIHRVDDGGPAAALHQLFAGPDTGGSGTVTLSFVNRQALADGRLALRVYSRSSPGGAPPISLGLNAFSTR